MTTDTQRYNGWANWATWNCALWLGNDERLYNLARRYRLVSYDAFIETNRALLGPTTPDGARWDEADDAEMNEFLSEL